MSIPEYVLGYPQDRQSLGASKLQIRSNLDGTFETLAVDHVDNNGDPGNNPPGYHTIIHQVKQTSNPAPIIGINQLFSKVPTLPANGDVQLFSLTGMGGLSQMTGSSSNANGTFLFVAGFIIQMSVVTTTNTSGLVTLPTPFPNNFYSLTLTMKVSGVTTHAGGIYYQQNPPKTGFNWFVGDPPTSYNGFAWIAIGN
jgi:hypothetical protein